MARSARYRRLNDPVITYRCKCGMTTRGTWTALMNRFWCRGCMRSFFGDRRWAHGEDALLEHVKTCDCRRCRQFRERIA